MSSGKQLLKDKRITVAGGLAALLVVSYLIGQYVVLPLRTEKNVMQEESAAQEEALQTESGLETVSGESGTDGLTDIFGNIEWTNQEAAADNPWGVSAGLIDTEEGNKAIFLTPGTAAKLHCYVGDSCEIRLVYYVHPWVADVSDGLEFDVEVNGIVQDHLSLTAADVGQKKGYVIDVSPYRGQEAEISIIHSDQNGGDLSGDWLVVEGSAVLENDDGVLAVGSETQASVSFSLKEKIGLPDVEVPFQIVNITSEPVVERGTDEWDAVDVLNPSVIKWKDRYINYYSGFDGSSWRTGIAESDDGLSWKQYSGNPVFGIEDLREDNSGYIAANGSAILYDDKVYYFYQMSDLKDEPQIGLAVSEDAYHFTDYGVVFKQGEAGTWESNGVGDPYVIYENSTFYLYYLGMNESGIQRLGVAMSKDGIQWERSSANPILDVGCSGAFDENGLGEPSVYYNSPYYYMLYTGRNAAEQRNIGLAVSINGIDWRKLSYQGEFKDQTLWNREVICDTTFMNLEDQVVVYYGGGDKPEPAENLNGQIGMFGIDISQHRDMTKWDANADWSLSRVASEDVLYGSYEIDGEVGGRSSWCNAVTEIELLNDTQKSDICIKGWIPMDSLYKNANISEVKISVYLDGVLRESKIFTEDNMFEFVLSKGDEAGTWIDLRLEANSKVIPLSIGMGNDERSLSYKILSIEQK